MEKQFVPYKQSLELKELGFDEECLASFMRLSDGSMYLLISEMNNRVIEELNNSFKAKRFEVIAPLYQQAFDWFRDKYNLIGTVYVIASGYLFEINDSAKIGGSHKFDSGFDGPNDGGRWDTFEEARQACLEKLIEVCKKI